MMVLYQRKTNWPVKWTKWSIVSEMMNQWL